MEYKLGDIIKFTNGKKKPKSVGNIPVYGGNGILDYIDDYNHESVIVIGRVGAYCGSVYYESNKCWVSDNAIAVNPDLKNTDNLYMYYLLNTLQLNKRSIGTSQPLLTQNILKSIKVNIPKKNIQTKIANILSSFDDKIENNNKIINNLEEQAQAIFKSWFVDFEPFQDGEFVESELGMIPRGWKIANLDDIANYKNGLAMKKYQSNEDEPSLPVLKIKELRNNSTDVSSDRCTFNIPNDVKVYDGDIIFSWSASLLIDIWTGGEAGLNQHLFKVTSSSYEKWFYYLWTDLFLEEFKAIARDKATTMGHIKRSHLKESKVLIPTEEQLHKMNEIMNPIIDLIINLGIQSKKLAKTRDALLPKLMSGEVRVDEASEVS